MGTAAGSVQAAGGSALRRLALALEGPHLPLSLCPLWWSFFSGFLFGSVRLTSCSSESFELTSEKYEGSCHSWRSRADTGLRHWSSARVEEVRCDQQVKPEPRVME